MMPTPRAATELARDVRPRRVVDVGKTPARSCLLEYRLDNLSVRDPAESRRQTVEAATTNGREIADESLTRRSSNRLVSRARRQTDQIGAPSTVASVGRCLYSDPLQRRSDDEASCGWTLRTRRRSDERPRSRCRSE